MNARLLELREQRGQLRARCANGRETLAQHADVFKPAFAVAELVWSGTKWVKQHPALTGSALAVALLLKPRRLWRLWRWSQNLYALRNGWKNLSRKLPFFH
ncbi:MAG: YqjK-like family protein [Zoogloeaceae bacterium]|jgi:hypothetical protein|nr:YqjK-like family protein [Zoogloeaceae bacterium]